MKRLSTCLQAIEAMMAHPPAGTRRVAEHHWLSYGLVAAFGAKVLAVTRTKFL
jgi:hypothetical protein